jgi:hypothetical protein
MVGDSDGQLKKQTSMFLLLGKNDGDWCVCYAKVHSQLYATTNITAQLYATMCASASASASASAAASKILKKHPYFASNGAGLRRKRVSRDSRPSESSLISNTSSLYRRLAESKVRRKWKLRTAKPLPLEKRKASKNTDCGSHNDSLTGPNYREYIAS